MTGMSHGRGTRATGKSQVEAKMTPWPALAMSAFVHPGQAAAAWRTLILRLDRIPLSVKVQRQVANVWRKLRCASSDDKSLHEGEEGRAARAARGQQVARTRLDGGRSTHLTE